MRFLAFLSLIFISGSAYAANTPTAPEFFFKSYVGADYNYSNVDFSKGNSGVFARSYNGGDIHAGARVHKNLGFEASYFDSAHSTNTFISGVTPINTTAKLDGWAVDAMGYLPIPAVPRLELIGTAGLAHTWVKGTATAIGSVTLTDDETKPRIGAGAQYWVNDNLNVRGLVRYQDADFSGTINNIIIASLGLNWQF